MGYSVLLKRPVRVVERYRFALRFIDLREKCSYEEKLRKNARLRKTGLCIGFDIEIICEYINNINNLDLLHASVFLSDKWCSQYVYWAKIF